MGYRALFTANFPDIGFQHFNNITVDVSCYKMEEQTFIKKNKDWTNFYYNRNPLKIKYHFLFYKCFYNILFLLILLLTLSIKNKNMKYKQFI